MCVFIRISSLYLGIQLNKNEKNKMLMDVLRSYFLITRVYSQIQSQVQIEGINPDTEKGMRSLDELEDGK
jgi:hypothetical protein